MIVPLQAVAAQRLMTDYPMRAMLRNDAARHAPNSEVTFKAAKSNVGHT